MKQGSVARSATPSALRSGGGPFAKVVAMPTWRLRDFHDDDLDRAIQIWDQNQQADEAPAVFPYRRS